MKEFVPSLFHFNGILRYIYRTTVSRKFLCAFDSPSHHGSFVVNYMQNSRTVQRLSKRDLFFACAPSGLNDA
jgi:hypothetical protein